MFIQIYLLLFIFWIQGTSTTMEEGTINVQIVGLKNNKGNIKLSLYNSGDGFPKETDKAFKLATGKIENSKATFTFTNIPEGHYAIAVLHDENDNNKMDFAFYGKPKEGFGFSNNARKLFGPPDFDKAKFELKGNEMTLDIKLKYF